MQQREFAAELHVSPSRVSEWESGKRPPTSEASYRLGSLAPKIDDAIWFWKQAGLDGEKIRAAAGKMASDSFREIEPLIEKREVVLVPRYQQTAEGREEAGPPVPLATEFIPNPGSTTCFILDNRASGQKHLGNSVAAVDTSVNGANGLQVLWGEIVLVEFRPSAERDPSLSWIWPEGVFAGLLLMSPLEIGFLPPTWLAQIWPLRPSEAAGGWPITIGSWKYPFKERREKALTGTSREGRRVQDEIHQQAATNLRPATGCIIHGRVIGWFRESRKS